MEVIRCAKCGYRIGTYDGIGEIDKTIRCRWCRKFNVFHTKNRKTEIIEDIKRTTASGLRFY